MASEPRDLRIPRLGSKRVHKITASDVLRVLKPIWSTKPETARRLKSRISTVMRWAIAEGYRTDNPAGDAVTAALPRNAAVQEHHRALPHAEVGQALRTVRESGASQAAKLAFAFQVLTAARSGEVREARWDEVDMDAATWTVPAERMKVRREHRVPLSMSALAVLTEALTLSDGLGLIFPSSARRRAAAIERHAHQAADRVGYCRSAAWVPIELSRLGGRDWPAARARGASARSRHFEQGRGGICEKRSPRSTPLADGGMGAIYEYR